MSMTTPAGNVISERSNLHGSLKVVQTQLPLYESNRAGRVFVASNVAAGNVLPIFSNTAQESGIWNPGGSGVMAVLCSVAFTYVSTTGAAGGYVLAAVVNAGAAVATGGNISAFTDATANVTVWSGKVGVTPANVIRFAQGASTVTAPVIYRHLGYNQLVVTAADATTVPWRADYDFRGDIILPPGNALFVAGNIATLMISAVSMVWSEESEAGETA